MEAENKFMQQSPSLIETTTSDIVLTRIGLVLHPIELYQNDGFNNFHQKDIDLAYYLLSNYTGIDRDIDDNIKPHGYHSRLLTWWHPKRRISLIRKYPFNPSQANAVQYYFWLKVAGVRGINSEYIDSVIDILIDDNSFMVFQHGFQYEAGSTIFLWADVATDYLKQVLAVNTPVQQFPLNPRFTHFNIVLFIEKVKKRKAGVSKVQSARDFAFVLHGANNVQNYTKQTRWYKKYNGIVLRIKGHLTRVYPPGEKAVTIDVFCKVIPQSVSELRFDCGILPELSSQVKRKICDIFYTGNKELPYPCIFSQISKKANLVCATFRIPKSVKKKTKKRQR